MASNTSSSWNSLLGTGKSSQKLSFVLNDFSGGLVNTVADSKMSDNQSPDMLNMVFRNDGLIEKRPGVKNVNMLALFPTANNDDIKVWVVEPVANEPHLIVHGSNGLYYGVGQGINESDEWNCIYYDSNKPVIDGVQFGKRFYFVNGYDLLYYDLVSQKCYCVATPPDDSVPAPSPATEGSETFNKNPDPTTGYHHMSYIPAQLELEDNYKGKNIIPEKCSIIKVHKDRLYLSGNPDDPNMIYISDIMKGTYFPVGLCLQTPPTDDLITALATFDDQLIVGRRDSIYSISGNSNRPDSSSQYKIQKVNCHTGFVNNKSNNNIYSMLFFVGSDGNLYKLKPLNQYSNTLATTKLNVNLDLLSKPFTLNKQAIPNAFTAFDPVEGLWYIQINDETIVYHYDLMAFTRFNNIFAWQFFIMENELYFIKKNGSLCRFSRPSEAQYYHDELVVSIGEFGFERLNIPICAYWTSKNIDLGVPAIVKRFRNIYITAESFEDFVSSVHIDFDVDYVDINKSYDLFSEVPKWDVAKWDKYNWVNRNINKSLPIPINKRGRNLRIKYGCGYKFGGSYWQMPSIEEIDEYTLFYHIVEEKYYLRLPLTFVDGEPTYFREFEKEELDQTLLIHNITGIYQLRGYK